MKRVFRIAIAVFVSAIWFSATASGLAQDAADADKVEEKPKPEYPPEVQKAMTECIAKCIEARREPAQKEIEAVIAKLAELQTLDEAAVETLKERSKKAVESSLKPWGESLDRYLGEAFDEEAGVSAEEIKEFLKEVETATPAEVIEEIPVVGEARPDQQPEWRAALKEVLTADQLAAWEQREAEEKAKHEEQFAKLIEITSDNYKRQHGATMDPLVDDIIATAKLDDERSKKLKEAAETAIEQFVTGWKEKAAEYLEGTEESQRESMLKRGYISFGVESDSLPPKQKAWTEALEIILTKTEKEQWEKGVADRQSRREGAAKKMMITAIDELMALTAEQRRNLEPLVEGDVISTLTTQLARDHWGSMSVPRIVQYAKTADQSKIEAVLDDNQWERWQAAMKTSSTPRAVKPKVKEDTPKPPPGPNPVAMETAITAHLYRLMTVEREKILSTVLVQAEDAGRVVSLSPEARANLRTAAKGAAEEEIQAWATNMNSWVRRSIKGATPATIQQRLKSLGSVRFGRTKKSQDSPIWETAVSTQLNEDQRNTWQTEIDARNDFRSAALATLMIAQLDNAARLTNQQVEEIGPLLATAIEKYGPDLDRYFSSWSNDTPWYLNSYYNMIPFQGVPEKESKKILTKAQWKIWEERFQGQVSHYWDQVQQYHDQRMKAEEKAQEAKKKEKVDEEAAEAETVKES